MGDEAEDPSAEVARAHRAVSEDTEGHNCIICLQTIVDRTVIVTCGHDQHCFQCLTVWSDQSRKCPLCSRPMGDYLLHELESRPPYVKYFLPPFVKPSTAHPQHPALPPARRRQYPHSRRTERAASEEGDFERRLERRREIYRYGLYAKHIASNPTTRYKPAPTPAQFAANPDLISRAQIFLRREFLVWTGIDTEFMVTYIVGLMESIDIRSDAAVRLLRDFLDVGAEDVTEGGGRAEHFAHEVYSFLRSPFRDLKLYDAAVQYDPVPSSSRPPISPPSSRPESRIDRDALPNRDERSHARLASAFENLVDDGRGGLGEALGGSHGRVVRSGADDDDSASGSERSARGRGRGRSQHRSMSRSLSRSRSRSYDSQARAYSRDRYSPVRSRSPGPPRQRGSQYRSRSPLSPRSRHRGPPLSPRRYDRYDARPQYTYQRFDRRGEWHRNDDLERVPRSGRAALPDQGAVFDQRGPRRFGGPLGDRRGGPPRPQPLRQPHSGARPPLDGNELMEGDTLGEGMRAWSAADAAAAPVIALEPAGPTPQEADAHAASSLLGRIAGLNGTAPPTGPRNGRGATTAAAAGGAFGIRGAARQQPGPIAPRSASTPTGGKMAPVKAQGAPRNVLLQRLAEAKADALRVSALKAARVAAATETEPAPAPTAPVDEDVRTGISVTPLKRAPRKPDVSALKSRILERLQAERRGDGSNGDDGGGGGDGDGESEEQALRRKLLERRKPQAPVGSQEAMPKD